jgi:HPt (histidine-containing phosphotransfer) domain-containing protein
VGEGLAAEDWPAAREAAHSAKGASNLTGAYQLGSLCSAVEKALRENDPATARHLAEGLPAVFAAVQAAIAAVLAEHGSSAAAAPSPEMMV